MTDARLRAGSQIEWKRSASNGASLSTKPSSSVLFTMEQMNDWNRESACAISI